MRYFITGIDTEVGKTVVSSIFVEAFGLDYWKPVQSGDLHHTDTMKVQSYAANAGEFLPEGFRLTEPMSPHISAKIDGVEIRLEDFNIPPNENLVIEGAGGLLVPINYDGDYVADLIPRCNAEVILVSRNYLGSINHTLLSMAYLRSLEVNVRGIIIVGDPYESTEEIIQKNYDVEILMHVPIVEELTQEFITQQAERLRKILA